MAVTVERGDTLWAIAERELGDGSRWREILEANPDAVSRPGDETTLKTGASLTMPGEDTDDTAEEESGEEEQEGEPEGEQEDPVGVLAGGRTIRVKAGGETRLYQVYEFPPGSGSFVSYQFNDREQLEATLGEDFDITTRDQAWFNENVLAEADAEEVIGQEGSFQQLTDDIMREAALEAGIRDPGLIGRMASDPEMQDVMAQAFIGDWSEKQVRAAQRQTDFWKNELYPGIENFYGSSAEPERAWKEYQRTVEPALSKLGYERGPDGTFKDQMARMLDNKIDAETFLQQVPTFVRATQNAEFASTLNEWAERDLGKEVEFGDWFDLMAGESTPELEGVAEKATLAWVAENQGSNISQAQVEDLAARSQLTQQEAVAAFSEFNRSVLAVGEDGLKRYGLDRNTVLEMAAGIEPSSGESVDEVKLKVAKIARENDLADEQKLTFFLDFDEQGRPERPGLQGLSPEGA